jgi:hypothetical protein
MKSYRIIREIQADHDAFVFEFCFRIFRGSGISGVLLLPTVVSQVRLVAKSS